MPEKGGLAQALLRPQADPFGKMPLESDRLADVEILEISELRIRLEAVQRVGDPIERGFAVALGFL
jgi:hypothetical protein